MYLKSVEIIGFKSFAGKTKLQFEPGMTSVVGPNGCGKSNIADSIRWVLGEQSAKALRGAKMQDVIFNGTDNHKPVGMAEVSLTLTDCEEILGTEYNEVTITRRVLRSGEGQYFINRTPCRLKDIQRLFMDTGIGTSSYSLMEQGRIDQILSSRPDDRRAVFEEASGITKFKADRKEALRKLDHTEANLLRLDDIIKEVRRQIISLQRQAGKARRYKTLQESLRSYDIFLTRERLTGLDQRITQLETSLSGIREQEEAAREECQQIETAATSTRDAIAGTEQQINDAMEAASAARSRLERSRELIRINEDRIKELHTLSERDSRDAREAGDRLATHTASLEALNASVAEATQVRDSAEADFNTHQLSLRALEEKVEEAGRDLHSLRTELVDLESRAAKLQNELADLEAKERTTVVRRERLAAEQTELQRAVDQFAERGAAMSARLQDLATSRGVRTEELDERIARQKDLDQTAAALRQQLGEFASRAAARDAQIDMLEKSAAQAEGFPGGAKVLLDPTSGLAADRSAILGSLAEHIDAPESCRTALEAVLRSWLDAVVVRDGEAARTLLTALKAEAAGSARLLPPPSTPPPFPPHRA